MAQYNVSIAYNLKDNVTTPLKNIKKEGENSFKGVGNELNNVNTKLKSTESGLNSVKETAGGLKSTLLGIGATLGVGLGLKEIVNTRAEYEKFQAVLSNLEGSDVKGNETLARLKAFAQNTPGELSEVTGAFIKLRAQGIDPTNKQLMSLSDLSGSMGKSFDQLTEAIIDAQTGEFERLKEFGVKASVSGKKVSFMFKGVKTTVDNTAESIRKYVFGLGMMNGIAGTSQKQMKTLGGLISNMKDSVSNAANQIGEALRPAMVKVISIINSMATSIPKVIAFITKFSSQIKILAVGFAAFYVGGKIIKGLEAVKTGFQNITGAAGKMNMAMKANIWLAIASAIATATYELYKYTEAQKNINKLKAELNLELPDRIKQRETGKDILSKYDTFKTLSASGKEQFQMDVQNILDETNKNMYENANNINKIQKAINDKELELKKRYLQDFEQFKKVYSSAYNPDVIETKFKESFFKFGFGSAALGDIKKYNTLLTDQTKTQDLYKRDVLAFTGILNATGVPTNRPKTPEKQTIDSGVNELTAGSHNIKQVNVSISKMIGIENLNNTKISESITDIQKGVVSMLNNVLTDVQGIAR